MKTFRYIALAALTITFAACSQDEDFNSQNNPNAVRINATIGKLQTRVSYEATGNTKFIQGDQIRVENTKQTTKNIATYTYDDDSWSTTESLVWSSTSTNQFEAWYPATDNTSFDSFTLPTDQSTDAKLAAADWMTASTAEMEKPSNKTVDLSFQHLLTKVTIKVSSWGSEYEGTEAITNAKIYTLATAIAKNDAGVAESSSTALTAIAPLEADKTYTAIVCPGTYTSTQEIITFTVKGTDNLTVRAGSNTTLAGGLEAGKHYTFTLTVGKDKVDITGISVTPWEQKEIDGGVANEVVAE